MGRITFILGGARSGKSTYALQLARKYKKVAFIATCQAQDLEMAHRIYLHKKSRPSHWQTFEEPAHIDSLLIKNSAKFDCVIIDCLTLLISNLALSRHSQSLIENKIHRIISCLKKNKGRAIIVSNEVGLGIVPANTLGRKFRDTAGKVNQIVAGESDEVIFMVSGLPLRIKGERSG